MQKEGTTLICGGLGGVMEAACEGAKSAGGFTVGVLPGATLDAANPFVDIAIATAMGEARNLMIVQSSVAAIAVGGEYGTLIEVAFALKIGKPVFGLSTWDIPGVVVCASPSEAVQRALVLV